MKKQYLIGQTILWTGAIVAIEILILLPVSRPGGLMPLIVLLLPAVLSINLQKKSLEQCSQQEADNSGKDRVETR